jgi:hypothetical protein
MVRTEAQYLTGSCRPRVVRLSVSARSPIDLTEEMLPMHTRRRPDGDHTLFVVTDLDDAGREAARHLNFAPVEDGVARGFPSASPHLDRIYDTFSRSARGRVSSLGRMP